MSAISANTIATIAYEVYQKRQPHRHKSAKLRGDDASNDIQQNKRKNGRRPFHGQNGHLSRTHMAVYLCQQYGGGKRKRNDCNDKYPPIFAVTQHGEGLQQQLRVVLAYLARNKRDKQVYLRRRLVQIRSKRHKRRRGQRDIQQMQQVAEHICN